MPGRFVGLLFVSQNKVYAVIMYLMQIRSDVGRVRTDVLYLVHALVLLGHSRHRANRVHTAHYLLRVPANPPHTWCVLPIRTL